MTYNFRMEQILELRNNNEQNAFTKYSICKTRFDNENEILIKIKKEYSRIIQQKFQDYKNINYIKQLDLYSQSLLKKIENQLSIINQIKVELNKLKDELNETHKEKKIMQKLKEKDHFKYIDEIKRQEQMDMDEIALLKYNNKKL